MQAINDDITNRITWLPTRFATRLPPDQLFWAGDVRNEIRHLRFNENDCRDDGHGGQGQEVVALNRL